MGVDGTIIDIADRCVSGGELHAREESLSPVDVGKSCDGSMEFCVVAADVQMHEFVHEDVIDDIRRSRAQPCRETDAAVNGRAGTPPLTLCH